MKIISVLNHKGGVGKTTFTGSAAQALALMGFRVLAIDNDGQHNLSTLLGVGTKSPNIHDVYTASAEQAPATLLRSVRKTELPGLHLVSSCRDLSGSDVTDIMGLKQALDRCRLERFYDYILIDNGPGLDVLQSAALHASHEIFVPTELRQFAVNGLLEMEQTLGHRYPNACKITKIIPNFYRNTRRQNDFLAALKTLFPGRVSATAIPVDSVFDEMSAGAKILFLHRLYSKGAAYYLKLVHELFSLDEEKIWEQVKEKRDQRLSEEAKERLINTCRRKATDEQ